MEHGKGVFPGAGPQRLLGLLLAWVTGHIAWHGSGLILSFAALALYFQRHLRLKILAVTLCVFTKTCWALQFPAHSRFWIRFRLNRLSASLIQWIMIGIGAPLRLADLARTPRMSQAIVIGMLLQFLSRRCLVGVSPLRSNFRTRLRPM